MSNLEMSDDDALVSYMKNLARRVALARGVTSPQDIEELEGEALLKLTESWWKFDKDRGTEFRTFAHTLVSRHLNEYVSQGKLTTIPTPRNKTRLWSAIRRYWDDNPGIMIMHVCRQFNMTRAQYEKLREEMTASYETLGVGNADEFDEDAPMDLAETLDIDQPSPEDLAQMIYASMTLARHVGSLLPQESEVVLRLYKDEPDSQAGHCAQHGSISAGSIAYTPVRPEQAPCQSYGERGMSTERSLLAACVRDRAAFDLASKLIKDKDLSEPGKVVFSAIEDYYARDPHTQAVDVQLLQEQVLADLSNPKHRETFVAVLDGIASAEVSTANVLHVVKTARLDAIGDKIAQAMVSNDREGADKLIAEYEEVKQLSESDEQETALLHAPDLDSLLGEDGEGELIRVFPRSLNQRLDGGLRRGHHLVVFARPEMGKTLVTVNMVFGFLAQGFRVLYICNEEPVADVAIRILQRLTDRTKYEVLADKQGTYSLANERGYGNLFIQRMTPGTPREIESAARDVKADVLVIDQLRNIDVRGDSKTTQLEAAATAVRQAGGRSDCLVVSVVQAGDSATGKAVLEMSDVDSSKTGLQAQADVMLGVGATPDDEAAGRRVFSLPKNKRSGDHSFFPVQVDPTRSKVISLE